jgi:hypothetical protein
MILMSTVLYIKSKINLKQSFFRLTRPTTLLVSKVLPQITTNMDLKYFPVKSPDEGIIPPTAGGRATGTILKSCVMAISSGEFFPPGNSINAFHIAFNFQLLLRFLGNWIMGLVGVFAGLPVRRLKVEREIVSGMGFFWWDSFLRF